jgi:hypothetical protein
MLANASFSPSLPHDVIVECSAAGTESDGTGSGTPGMTELNAPPSSR